MTDRAKVEITKLFHVRLTEKCWDFMFIAHGTQKVSEQPRRCLMDGKGNSLIWGPFRH